MRVSAIFQGLGIKLVLMVVITLIFVSTGVGLLFIEYEQRTHDKELKDRGEEMAKGLARLISVPLIHNDRWEIYNHLKEITHPYEDNIVEYAFVTDINGEIIAHSDPKAFPMGMLLNDPITLNTLFIKNTTLLHNTDGGLLYDIASPVFYNRNITPIGIARIGITKKYINKEIRKELTYFMWTTAVFSLIGIIGAILFSMTLSIPLRKLSNAATAISNGELDKEIIITKKDEIGKLAYAFNEMRSHIKESKKELELLSIIDPVTGLYNHRHFYKLLVSEFEKCKRYNYPISCVMFDVDYFKSINDTHGHQAGSLVLKELGELISSELRASDTISRYGGDEFMILLPHTGGEAVWGFADKIRRKVEGHKFSKDSYPIVATISIGISIFPDKDMVSPDDMIKNADATLYRAKMEGRNKICIWMNEESSRGDTTHASKKFDIKELKEGLSNLTINIKKAYMESAVSLIKSLDSRDMYSSRHSYNVSIYALKLANKIDLPQNEITALHYAAILHDIGKIGVKEEILKKSSKLSKDEFEAIKRHPMIAVDLMEDMRFWDRELTIIRHHHERYDGLGYPDGIRGENIPIEARILTLTDAFDTITSERTYKEAKSIEEAINEFKAHSGTQFDPELVKLFIEIIMDEKK